MSHSTEDLKKALETAKVLKAQIEAQIEYLEASIKLRENHKA